MGFQGLTGFGGGATGLAPHSAAAKATGGKVESTFLWIKIILAVIGLGVLLYLLKPLFNMITAGRKASSIKSMSQAYGAV